MRGPLLCFVTTRPAPQKNSCTNANREESPGRRLWDSHERKRLFHEAREFLTLRAERLKWARKGGDYDKPMVSVPGASSASGND